MTTPTTDHHPFDPAEPLPPMRSHGKNPRDAWLRGRAKGERARAATVRGES